MRLFIACPISEEARTSLAEIQDGLSARLPGWRWSKPENLHLTLAFLGETAEEKIPMIEDIMRRACVGALAFKVEFKGLGAFASPRDPRVLYLGCTQGEKTLAALAGRLLPELSAAKLLPEAEKDRAFRAHLTLARRPPGLARQKAAANFKAVVVSKLPGISSLLDSIVLYQSKPSDSGSKYLPVFRLGLDK